MSTSGRCAQGQQDRSGGRTGQVFDGERVECGEERLLCLAQGAAQPARRAQWAGRFVLAADDVARAFELPDEAAYRPPAPGGCEGESAAAAPAGLDDPPDAGGG
ncbi:hypothetical protein GCM10020000_15760 [Streptomyces olivoverticillatus]